jgi:hypothetical protein
MIPTCLVLTPEQIKKVKTFRASLPPLSLEEMEEVYGGACFTSDITFHIHTTSVGDVVIAEAQGHECNLSPDDSP